MHDWLIFLLLIFAGSSLGGLCRFALSGMVARRFGERFPFGTLIVNISGAFLIGMAWVVLSPGAARDFLMFGFLGGYTTVSSFSLNTLTLLQDGQWFHGALNFFGSFLLCLAAVFGGAGVGALLITT
jgi:fluoride exporter